MLSGWWHMRGSGFMRWALHLVRGTGTLGSVTTDEGAKPTRGYAGHSAKEGQRVYVIVGDRPGVTMPAATRLVAGQVVVIDHDEQVIRPLNDATRQQQNRIHLVDATENLARLRTSLDSVVWDTRPGSGAATMGAALKYHLETFERLIRLGMVVSAGSERNTDPQCRRCDKSIAEHVVFHDQPPTNGLVEADFGPELPMSGIYCRLPLT